VTDQAETPPASWQPPLPSDPQRHTSPSPAVIVEQRPEVGVGAAFAGGFVLALILKRLAR
jgi:hypothetical protein